jgi:2-polyprenyl-3-methyl-5-hydroxy-6-metoxy-1,4-benzoquinol methylase
MECVCCEKNLMEIYQTDSYLKLPIYFCKNCKSYTTGKTDDERKNQTDLLYKKSYWDERLSENSINSDYTDVDSQGKQRQWISQYKYCKSFLSNKKKILEVGSGPGQVLFWFNNLGLEVHGLEPDKRNVELINKKIGKNVCEVGIIEDFETNQKFDIIWSSHVFEHVLKPKLVLDKLKNFLNKDGILFLEVPNCENSKILFESINNNPSTFHFSKFSLMKLAENSGYKIISCEYFRSAKLIEGGINKIKGKYFNFLKYEPYPFYPKIISSNTTGTDIRIILKN